jgi:arsenite-transporting ATPase
MRIILYTGKGGVGKTTLAAASAVQCAELGYRTIIVSTDAAHSLGDSFDQAIGPQPTQLAPNLWAQEIDVVYQMENYWGTIRSWFSGILALRGVDELIAEEASVIPGMDELSNLFQIAYLHETGNYDVIVVDCAPTGETLSLLSVPEAAGWYLNRIFPIERQAARIARPLLRALVDIRIPGEDVFDAIQGLIVNLTRVQTLLTDRSLTTVRLVVNPEKMVIREAQRSFSCLSLYGFAVDAVFSNRIIPPGVDDPYFGCWKAIQERHSAEIQESFFPIPIFQVPLMEQEVVGIDMLRQLAHIMYREDRHPADKGQSRPARKPRRSRAASVTEPDSMCDPASIFFEGESQRIEKTRGKYRLSLPIPFVTGDQLAVSRHGDNLTVTLGNWRRTLLLPRALSGLEAENSVMEEGRLLVTFAASPAAPDRPSGETGDSPPRRGARLQKAVAAAYRLRKTKKDEAPETPP